MSRALLHLGWAQFDEAVVWLHRTLPSPSAIYGPPRGGLPLAVALSHAWGVPLTDRLAPGVLWVDDIVDSGKTLRAAMQQGVTYAAWVQRGDHGIPSPIILGGDEWVVFPWEQISSAQQEAEAYDESRH